MRDSPKLPFYPNLTIGLLSCQEKKILKNPIFSYKNRYIISLWGVRRDLDENLAGWEVVKFV